MAKEWFSVLFNKHDQEYFMVISSDCDINESCACVKKKHTHDLTRKSIGLKLTRSQSVM